MAQVKWRQPANVNTVTRVPFARMTAIGKIRFVGKVVLFLVTFGFAYPNVFIE